MFVWVCVAAQEAFNAAVKAKKAAAEEAKKAAAAEAAAAQARQEAAAKAAAEQKAAADARKAAVLKESEQRIAAKRKQAEELAAVGDAELMLGEVRVPLAGGGGVPLCSRHISSSR